MVVIDYKAPDEPRSQAGLVLALVAAALSVVPWLVIASLDRYAESHDMGPGAGIGDILISMFVSGLTVLLLLFWLWWAVRRGWSGRIIAGMALSSTLLWWVSLFAKG